MVYVNYEHWKKVYEGLKFATRSTLKYGISMYFFEDHCLLTL